MITDWKDRKKEIMDTIGDYLLNHNKNGFINENKKNLISNILENCHKYGCDDKTIEMNAKILSRMIVFDLIGVQTTSPYYGGSHQIHTLVMDNNQNIQIKQKIVTPSLNDYITQPTENDSDIISEICLENDSEIIKILMDAKPEKENDVFRLDDIEIVSGMYTIYDGGLKLSNMIKRQAEMINTETRRGYGNWCIVSPVALTVLQSTRDNLRCFFEREEKLTDLSLYNGIIYVGKLDGISVYCNKNARYDEPIIIGYKGSDIDAGLYYVPTVPLEHEAGSYKKIDTYYSLEKKDNNISEMSNYYRYIDMDVLQYAIF